MNRCSLAVSSLAVAAGANLRFVLTPLALSLLSPCSCLPSLRSLVALSLLSPGSLLALSLLVSALASLSHCSLLADVCSESAPPPTAAARSSNNPSAGQQRAFMANLLEAKVTKQCADGPCNKRLNHLFGPWFAMF